MSVLKFALVLIDRLFSIHVTISLGIVGDHPSLKNSRSLSSKWVGSKDTDRSETRDAVEWVSTSLLLYEDTKLIVDKDIKMKWYEVNDTFLGTFGEDLENCKVSMNIHKSGLYYIACKYPAFPCTDMMHYIISHTDPETMVLISVRET